MIRQDTKFPFHTQIRNPRPRAGVRKFYGRAGNTRAGLRHTEALIGGEEQSLVGLAATVTQVSAAIGVDPLRPR